ncbi:MAG: hypothetical protein AAGC60_00600 [Acidobacteriota bacterium]
MSIRDETPPRAKRSGGSTLADLLDRVRWDYDPVRDDVTSPLVTTERFFDDFPWHGRRSPTDA